MQMVITVIRGYSEHKTVFAKSAGLLNLPGFPDVRPLIELNGFYHLFECWKYNSPCFEVEN